MPNPQAMPKTTDSREIYLDNNATTRPLPEVRQAMIAALGEDFGNPSSAHATGERGRRHLSRARAHVAQLLGSEPENLVFTSSGTESNNMALVAALAQPGAPQRIVTTSVEHSSVLKHVQHLSAEGVEITLLNVNVGGRIDLRDLEDALRTPAALVSVQWVNNETGVFQDMQHIAKMCTSSSTLLHTDACQAAGKLEIDLEQIPIDFLTLTAHKFHGPQGVGAIYARERDHLRPLLFGGSQEHGLRGGTENVAGIVGLGKAAQLRLARLHDLQPKLSSLRDYFDQLVLQRVPNVTTNGDRTHRACNTTNLHFKDVDGQALVARLDIEGIRCSQSSACTNRRPEPSYVLRAMGLSEDDAYSSVRFSVSEETTEEELVTAAAAIARICAQLRQFSGGKSAAPLRVS